MVKEEKRAPNNKRDQVELIQEVILEPAPGLIQEQAEDYDWGSLKITGKDEIKYNMVIVTDNYTVVRNDRIVLVNQGSGTKTATLPEGRLGKIYTIKMLSANQVDITGTGSETIDGSATISMTSQYDWRTVIFGGTEWHIIASS